MLIEMKDPDHEDTIAKMRKKVEVLDQEIASVQTFIRRQETEKVWVDWVGKFGKTIGDYRKIKTAEDRIPILQRFLWKIEVGNVDTQTKSLKFHFEFGYVDDHYDKSTRQTIPGERFLDLVVGNEILTKLGGRPKKLKPNHIDQSVKVE